LLAVLAAVWLRRFRYSARDIGFGPVQPRLLLLSIVVGISLACAFEFAVVPTIDWFRRVVGDVIPTAETRRALGSARVPFAIANIALAPFIEELTYRGILERRISSTWSKPTSFFWGALAFGLLHWAGGISFVIGTGGLGAMLLYLRRRTGSLWPAILAHFAFNTLEVALSLAR
jgi:membrane protease YdiL (CAAX protease family)